MEQLKRLEAYINTQTFKKSHSIPGDKKLSLRLLAQGEYNINYTFIHPKTEKKIVLRLNTKSQMHLENQIEYEYQALKILEHSGCTPIPYYYDLEEKILTMEYIEGRTLNYGVNLSIAAGILADVHSVEVPKNNVLIETKFPLKEILAECENMYKIYEDSPLGDISKKEKMRRLLNLGHEKVRKLGPYLERKCCINTELNSGNFLINGEGKQNYLIDWEKPLYGDPAQDLGHFLAPTTTFWKTDVILKPDEIDYFIKIYEEKVNNRFGTGNLKKRVLDYIPITCLRGITWCAMAYIEYQNPKKTIRNQDTIRKIEEYLEPTFLDHIEKRYF